MVGRQLEPGRLERGSEAGQPRLAALGRGPAAQVGDAPVPELDEVSGRCLATPEVGRAHADDVACGHVHRVDHDEWQPHPGERRDLVVPDLVGHRDDRTASVDGEVARPGRGLELRRGQLVDRLHADRDCDPELRGGGRDALDDLGGVGADLAAEGQLDRRVPLDRLQPAAVVVGAEHLLHPGAGRRGHVAAAVEHLRDRGDGDTRRRGHGGQRRTRFCRRHLGAPLVVPSVWTGARPARACPADGRGRQCGSHP